MRPGAISFILAGLLLSGLGCKQDRTPASSDPTPEAAAVEVAPGASGVASGVAPGASEASPAVPAPAPKRDLPAGRADHRPLVVCFGDSLTAGHGADPGASYPDFLQQDLDHAGFHVRVVNEGISGNTTKDGVDRLAQVLALKPEIVVLEFGGNDGLRGLKVETTRQNLATMIEALKQARIKVVIAGITLPPDYGHDYISRFTGNYTSLGRQYRLPVLPFLLQNVYGVAGMMQADRTHATDKGNEVVAKNVLPYVEKLLR